MLLTLKGPAILQRSMLCGAYCNLLVLDNKADRHHGPKSDSRTNLINIYSSCGSKRLLEKEKVLLHV
jgi:hypothetical protein